ncbi:MAG TPA: type II toxin-antitoxin system death-on-curing family toxin [Actinobacteria bacterium]|nr:type II toxin-antitoxin system death-on-curing family toxin [Actinomycetota bacterium]
MIKLNVRDVLSLYKIVCSATGGISEIRDIGALESAIYHSYASFEGKDLYETIEEKASRHAYGIIRNHPFLDGNKRTGLFVMLVFLELNGIELKFSQSELVALGTNIAKGTVDSRHIEKWIIRHKEKK